jgi:hypothetical protein
MSFRFVLRRFMCVIIIRYRTYTSASRPKENNLGLKSTLHLYQETFLRHMNFVFWFAFFEIYFLLLFAKKIKTRVSR